MTQPQSLTSQQIQNYQNQIQNAGTLAQQKAAAVGVSKTCTARAITTRAGPWAWPRVTPSPARPPWTT
jgi:hypothetical protein